MLQVVSYTSLCTVFPKCKVWRKSLDAKSSHKAWRETLTVRGPRKRTFWAFRIGTASPILSSIAREKPVRSLLVKLGKNNVQSFSLAFICIAKLANGTKFKPNCTSQVGRPSHGAQCSHSVLCLFAKPYCYGPSCAVFCLLCVRLGFRAVPRRSVPGREQMPLAGHWWRKPTAIN